MIANLNYVNPTINSNICLIIDDEITDEEQKAGFLARIGLPKSSVIFAHSYQEAVEAIENINSIAFCFVDCRIPKTNEDGDYEKYWGLDLLPFLAKKQIFGFIYSAFVQQNTLTETVSSENCIIGAAKKPITPKDLNDIKQLYLEKIFAREIKIEEQINNETLNFNYDQVDEENRILLQDSAKKIKFLKNSTIENVIMIGNFLLDAKSRLAHGTFVDWCSAELALNKTTASRYMNLARANEDFSIEEMKSIKDLRVLYKLASKSTPRPVFQEAVKLAAEEQVAIKEETVKKLKAKHEKNKQSNLNLEQPIKTETLLTPPTDSILTKPLEPSTLKPQILKVHPKYENSCWQINTSLLFCGQFNIDTLNKFLPSSLKCKIELLIGDNYNIQPFNNIKAENTLILQSPYKDIDLEMIKNGVAETLYCTTNARETVLFNCIIDSAIFELAQDLDCLCYVVEPNVELCKQIIEQSQSKKRMVKRLSV